MSTNPETWRKALRLSDPRLLWRVASFPTRVFVISSAVWAVLLVAASLPWADTAQALRERASERAELAPVFAEAKRLDLTFPQVIVSHPAWPIIWTNPDRVKAERIWKDRVLARVAAVMDDAVYLEFVGRP